MRHSRSVRVALGVLVPVLLAGGAVFLVGQKTGSSPAGAAHRFVEKESNKDLAGNRGEPGANEAKGEDPAAAAEAAFAARAYPADDIPINAARQSLQNWTRIKAKGPGKPAAGQWTLAGPSNAQYPAVLTFSGAKYTASGRITALAIDPACSKSKCRLWVAAAGGGVWRTDKALAGNAKWTFLSGSFGTNAIGTLTYANGVLYAGTGEPNASGDSEAGLGIYRSTDGGDTWTHLASLVTGLTSNSCAASDATGACTTLLPNGT